MTSINKKNLDTVNVVYLVCSLFSTDMDFFMLYFLFFLYGLFKIFCKLVKQRHHACYILDYECYKPSDDRKLTAKHTGNIVLRIKNLGRDELQFLLRVMLNSGIGEESYGPQNFFGDREQSPSLSDGMLEMEFFYHTLDNLFSKAKISPSEIDLLVINISTFSPAPSLAARIVNHHKMRDNIKIFNLTGMGCSASLISINLVQNMFKTYKNLLALVLSTESIAPNIYLGKDKSMMLTNLLFRSGGTAILLTNKTDFRQKAMFKLKYLVRTHLGANDDAYQGVMQKEDDDGYQGIVLSKNLPEIVASSQCEPS
ncbi:3-ketoacyl-CoA synthase [Thalictrum thalictroides]|uniref:3-ketoacyl-CoA synthase n=1 Tax=Thalictrum thalictroides TaxID=46969 RepID=A0A7J6V5Y7_THATH|nr:3-ketoacyl-CoA synthase [Thalictrum thalictroides]